MHAEPKPLIKHIGAAREITVSQQAYLQHFVGFSVVRFTEATKWIQK